MWTYDRLRQTFLDYFIANKHIHVPSASLIPQDDPSLLFVNAGMVPFKHYFLGQEQPSFKQACSSQRCLRVGGKHNDLEQVGFTSRHHTLFEMLGNFSFGDYFKERAILLAWQFITKELMIPVDKLYVTVHESDDEAEEIWLKVIGLPASRVIRCGDADNFWMMGEIGPCGPCSEIFYDHGPQCQGGLPGSDEQEGDRYMEIWNLVFMQYEKQADGTVIDLPHPSVDTGMGLERLAAVMQGVTDTYDIDLFKKLMAVIRSSSQVVLPKHALKILVDHLRAVIWLIADQVVPSNEGRGYVLRRLLRRACRLAYQAGMKLPGLHQIIPDFCLILESKSGPLHQYSQIIKQRVQREEEQFVRTLSQGLSFLDQHRESNSSNLIDGALAFKLYDTFGFPIDITMDYAREHNLKIDQQGFEKHMMQQRQRSKSSQGFKMKNARIDHGGAVTDFRGYEFLEMPAVVQQLWACSADNVSIDESKRVQVLNNGQKGIVILDQTTCYAESGGQVGDQGLILLDGSQFDVVNTVAMQGAICHIGHVTQGQLHEGDAVSVLVDQQRHQTVLNHSATHLLHAALRAIVGMHVLQKGSLVEPKRLRFDFAHHQPLTQEEIFAVEQYVNEIIRTNIPAQIDSMPLAKAMETNAIALFGEKYSDPVRVVKFADVSVELCGGTHVPATGDIGCFKIVTETAVAAGVRRIEAVTGAACVSWWQSQQQQLQSIEKSLKLPLSQIEQHYRDLKAEVKMLKEKHSQAQINAHEKWLAGQLLANKPYVVAYVEGQNSKGLMQLCDRLLQGDIRLVCLLTGKAGSFQYVAASDENAVMTAKQLLSKLSKQMAISGGGRDQRVQGVVKEGLSAEQLVKQIEDQVR